MAKRAEIVSYIDTLLDVKNIPDYGPQGMQVEGSAHVVRIVLGVSAHQALFEAATKIKAEMIIVHHGLLWDNLPRTVVGWRKSRLKILLDHDITLLGYHLALDAHREIGNNAQLGAILGCTSTDILLYEQGNLNIGWMGSLPEPVTFTKLVAQVSDTIGKPLAFPFGKELVSTIGIVSGGAGSIQRVSEAIDKGCDVYLTGVLYEESYALAREAQLNIIAAGHYNTEKFGVIALGKKLEEKFGVATEFVDIPNPL